VKERLVPLMAGGPREVRHHGEAKRGGWPQGGGGRGEGKGDGGDSVCNI